MNRQIKFRGRCIGNGFQKEGEMVYGSLIAYEDNASSFHCWICSQGQEPFHIDYPVDPESVAQLVGYDKDGNEVYEGDIVVDDIAEYVTHLFPNIRISECKLKEEPKSLGKIKEAST